MAAKTCCRECGADVPQLVDIAGFVRLLRSCEIVIDCNETERRTFAFCGDELARMLGDLPNVQ